MATMCGMRVALTLMLALASCGGDDDGDGAAMDAGRVDAAAGACRFIDEGPTISGSPPDGTWSVEWTCRGGCDLAAPSLTTAASVEIAGGELHWSNGAVMQAVAVGACWHVDASADECRSPFRACLVDDVLRIDPAHWDSPAIDWAQRWVAVGER